MSLPYPRGPRSIRQIRQLVLTGFLERMEIRGGHLLLAHEVGVSTHAREIILNNLKTNDNIVGKNYINPCILKNVIYIYMNINIVINNTANDVR